MEQIYNLPTLLRLFLFACLSATLIILIIFIVLLLLSRRKVKSQIGYMISSFIAILMITFIRTPLYSDFPPLVLEIINYLVLLPAGFGLFYFFVKKDYIVILDILVYLANIPYFHQFDFFYHIHLLSVGYFLIRSV